MVMCILPVPAADTRARLARDGGRGTDHSGKKQRMSEHSSLANLNFVCYCAIYILYSSYHLLSMIQVGAAHKAVAGIAQQ